MFFGSERFSSPSSNSAASSGGFCEAFRTFDLDKDGSLSRDELVRGSGGTGELVIFGESKYLWYPNGFTEVIAG